MCNTDADFKKKSKILNIKNGVSMPFSIVKSSSVFSLLKTHYIGIKDCQELIYGSKFYAGINLGKKIYILMWHSNKIMGSLI